MEDVYGSILKCQEYLDVDNPVPLPATTEEITLDFFRRVGYEEGDYIPGNIQEYFSEVVKLLHPEDPSPKKHATKRAYVTEAMQHEAVRDAMENAIIRIRTARNIEQESESEAKKKLGTTADMTNPIVKKMYDSVKQAEAERIQQSLEEEAPQETAAGLNTPYTGKEASNPVVYKMECPRCRLNLCEDYKPAPIDDLARRDFLIYVLGGETFKRTYDRWNGMVKLTFQCLDSQRDMLLKEQYAKDLINHTLDNDVFADIIFKTYRAALTLTQIQFDASLKKPTIIFQDIFSDAFKPTKEQTRLGRYVQESFVKLVSSRELMNAVFDCSDQFALQVQLLQEGLYTKDFWQGATVA